MNSKPNQRQSPEPIQRSDLAIAILTGVSLAGLFITLKFINPEDKYRQFVLAIIGVVAIVGIFYLTTRFLNMYNVLAGNLAIKLAFVLLLLIFILILAFLGDLDRHMYYSIITAFLGFIGGLGFSKYIFH